jgi:rod shape-determining protein MreD
MSMVRQHGGWVIVLTLVVGLMLAIVPLPEWAQGLRPEWPLLVLVYWCLALPQRVGVGVSWLVGLCMDVLSGALLGEHAIGYALVAYLVLKLYQQIRVYPAWQQAMVLLGVLLFNQVVCLWVLGMTERAPDDLLLFMVPSLVGMLLWPWLFSLLRYARRRFAVT